MSPNPPAQRTKPRLRGVSHEIAAYLSIPAVLALLTSSKTSSARMGAATYGVTLAMLFAVSALYHRPMWSERARRILWRIDHSAIFLLIAGTYTPLGLLMGPGVGLPLLALVWTGAVVGIGISVFWVTAPKRFMAAAYVVLGWFIVPVLPAVYGALGLRALVLLLVGGAFYTVGAMVYAYRRPDPFPTVFGFHEIFHVLVVAAAACHYLVVQAATAALT